MMDIEFISDLRSALVNTKCTGMKNLGNYLQLNFDEWLLVVSGFWRLIGNGELIMSADSNPQILETLDGILIGLTITNVDVEGDLNDLKIFFEDGKIKLEIFGDSETYEHWNLLRGGEMFIAGPGNLWSKF